MHLIEFKNASYENDGQLILDKISVSIHAGDFISIIGPSGSGKSTFLKLCSHLVGPTEGDILYKGLSIAEYNPTELRKSIAYCFQTPYLFGATVRDNINFPFTIRSVKPVPERINELFSRFHMTTDFLDKEVRNLSGGEKQRIALIRSLLFKPEALLLDEVTSALDADNTKIVENVIASLNKEGVTVLWITHNLDQSRTNSNKRLTLEAGRIKSLEVLQ